MQPKIMLFDSGVGGLSVYEVVCSRLPHAHYFYLFDNALYPYGALTEKQIQRRCLELLLPTVETYAVDLLIIACNTASTQVLALLRKHLKIPIVGVVPAIKPAAERTQNGIVGVLATQGTLLNAYTRHLITRFADDKQVILCPAPGLVEQAERKLQGMTVCMETLAKDLAPLMGAHLAPDQVVLGCTHFPILRDELSHLLPGTHLIDSGDAIARRVIAQLDQFTFGTECDAFPNTALYTKHSSKVERLQSYFTAMGFDAYQPIMQIKTDIA